jgi:hypothetical protein
VIKPYNEDLNPFSLTLNEVLATKFRQERRVKTPEFYRGIKTDCKRIFFGPLMALFRQVFSNKGSAPAICCPNHSV